MIHVRIGGAPGPKDPAREETLWRSPFRRPARMTARDGGKVTPERWKRTEELFYAARARRAWPSVQIFLPRLVEATRRCSGRSNRC